MKLTSIIGGVASNYVLWGFGALIAFVLWTGRFPLWFKPWQGPVSFLAKCLLIGAFVALAYQVFQNDQKIDQ